jgi:hypothetical protein
MQVPPRKIPCGAKTVAPVGTLKTPTMSGFRMGMYAVSGPSLGRHFGSVSLAVSGGKIPLYLYQRDPARLVRKFMSRILQQLIPRSEIG